MYLKELGIRGFRQFDQFEVSFQPGVTALVGRNDSGKSAIIDAVRFALQTRDQEYVRLQHEDFHLGPDGQAVPLIQITCILCDLTNEEKGAFIEYLSYRGGEPFVQVNWNAQRLPVATSRRWLDVTVRSGIDGGGPPLEASVRQLLSAAYLKPLRDAEREMSPGRGSRLSQILSQVTEVRQGDAFLAHAPPEEMESVARLSLVGLGDFMRHHVQNHAGVASAQSDINLRYLAKLLLHGDDLQGRIDITEGGSEQARLRRLLERLELGLLKGASGIDAHT